MEINRSLNKHRAALIDINREYPPAPWCVRKVQTSSAAGTQACANSSSSTGSEKVREQAALPANPGCQ